VIVAYTDYDCISRVLAGAARMFVQKAVKHVTHELPPKKSLAASIGDVLKQNPAPLLFFGHGQVLPPGLIGQDRKPAISGQHAQFVANRFVVGVSCYSYEVLSALAPARPVAALAFKGRLAVPLLDPYRGCLQACILEGLQSLLNRDPVGAARIKMKAAFQKVAWHLQGVEWSDFQQMFELHAMWHAFERNVEATNHMGNDSQALF